MPGRGRGGLVRCPKPGAGSRGSAGPPRPEPCQELCPGLRTPSLQGQGRTASSGGGSSIREPWELELARRRLPAAARWFSGDPPGSRVSGRRPGTLPGPAWGTHAAAVSQAFLWADSSPSLLAGLPGPPRTHPHCPRVPTATSVSGAAGERLLACGVHLPLPQSLLSLGDAMCKAAVLAPPSTQPCAHHRGGGLFSRILCTSLVSAGLVAWLLARVSGPGGCADAEALGHWLGSLELGVQVAKHGVWASGPLGAGEAVS